MYLDSEADFYQREGVFPEGTIENFIKKLKAFDDQYLSDQLLNKTDDVKELVDQYLHCM